MSSERGALGSQLAYAALGIVFIVGPLLLSGLAGWLATLLKNALLLLFAAVKISPEGEVAISLLAVFVFVLAPVVLLVLGVRASERTVPDRSLNFLVALPLMGFYLGYILDANEAATIASSPFFRSVLSSGFLALLLGLLADSLLRAGMRRDARPS